MDLISPTEMSIAPIPITMALRLTHRIHERSRRRAAKSNRPGWLQIDQSPRCPKPSSLSLPVCGLQEFELRPFHIQFKGYNEIGGKYLFQLHLDDVPSPNQPPMKAIGDQLGFEGYIIGPFHQIFKDEEDPTTHSITPNVDESTLELDKPDIDRKVVLPFRKTIDSPGIDRRFRHADADRTG